MVKGLPNLGPPTQGDLYGSQRRRAQLPLKRTTGDVLQGPRFTHDEDYDGEYDPGERPPGFRDYGGLRRDRPLRNGLGQIVEGPRRRPTRPYMRKGNQTLISINGKRIGAKRALDTYPTLREYLQSKGKRRVKDSTLVKRLRKQYREEGISDHMVNAREARVVQDTNHRIRSNIVSHHNLVNPDRELSVLDFMSIVKPRVTEFFLEHLLNKVKVVLKYELEKKDGYTDRYAVLSIEAASTASIH